MAWFVVGIDGDKTPDPAYWRDRWERIEAKDRHEAEEKWVVMREGWLRTEEIPHIFVDEEPLEYINELEERFGFIPRLDGREHKRRR